MNNLRGVREGGGEAEHLLLAAGQRPGVLAAPVGEDREPAVRPLTQAGVAEREAQVLFDGEVGKDSSRLGHDQHASANPLVRWDRGDVLTGEQDSALVRDDQPGGDVAERRLPGSVGAEERHDRSFRHGDVDAVQDVDLAVAAHDAPDH